ncbi:zinc finger, CCHC-type containing protein [Tanacetum coccineum]
MAGNMVKDMTINFGKLDKFEGHDFKRWQKKMHFLLTTLKVVYVLTTPMPELVEDATVEAIRIRAKWENNDYICRGHILNDDLSLVQLGSHLRIEESLRARESDKGMGKEVGGPPVNMTEEGKNKHNKQNKGKNGPIRTTVVLVSTRNQSWNVRSVARLVTSKGIAVVVKRTMQMLVVRERGIRTNPKTKVDAITWWIDSGAMTHVCKDHCWFKTYEPVKDGFVLYMGDEHFTPVHGKGSVALEFRFGYFNNGMFMLNLNKVPDDPDSVYMSSSTVVNSSLWHARLGHMHYKRMLKMSKDDLIPAIDKNPEKCTTCMLTKITRKEFQSITRKSVILELIHSDLCDFHATPSLGNKKYVITFIDDASRFCYVYLLHAKDEALDKFRIYKTEVELQQNDLIKTLRTNIGGEYYDPVFFQSVGITHETTAPYTPQQNGVAERKNRALKEMVNSMLSYSGLSKGLWGEAMLTACNLLNRVPNKRNI